MVKYAFSKVQDGDCRLTGRAGVQRMDNRYNRSQFLNDKNFTSRTVFSPIPTNGSDVYIFNQKYISDRKRPFADCVITRQNVAIGMNSKDCLNILLSDGDSVASALHMSRRQLKTDFRKMR